VIKISLIGLPKNFLGSYIRFDEENENDSTRKKQSDRQAADPTETAATR
jgi:hypothetical protein